MNASKKILQSVNLPWTKRRICDLQSTPTNLETSEYLTILVSSFYFMFSNSTAVPLLDILHLWQGRNDLNLIAKPPKPCVHCKGINWQIVTGFIVQKCPAAWDRLPGSLLCNMKRLKLRKSPTGETVQTAKLPLVMFCIWSVFFQHVSRVYRPFNSFHIWYPLLSRFRSFVHKIK